MFLLQLLLFRHTFTVNTIRKKIDFFVFSISRVAVFGVGSYVTRVIREDSGN